MHPASVTLHWHAHVVSGLAFSSDGAYLYSGGQEAVLVTWQLGTTHRSFLPRLGGAVESVRVGPSNGVSGMPTVAVSLADNSVRLVSSLTGQVESIMSGITVAGALNPLMTQRQRQRALRSGPAGNSQKSLLALQVEPRGGCVVLPGRAGSLQFYDVSKDRHVMDVEVVGYNSVHSSGHDRSGEVQSHGHGHVVEHCAFSGDGQWMVTADRRSDAVARRCPSPDSALCASPRPAPAPAPAPLRAPVPERSHSAGRALAAGGRRLDAEVLALARERPRASLCAGRARR